MILLTVLMLYYINNITVSYLYKKIKKNKSNNSWAIRNNNRVFFK